MIRLIRQKTDILLLTTLGFTANDDDADNRIDIQCRLAEDPQTRPDIVPIDMGTMNFEEYHADTKTFDYVDRIYHNPTDTIIHAADRFTAANFSIQIVCWNIGFVRRAGILMEQGHLKEPAYFLLNLADDLIITGHPCTPTSLDSMVEVLPHNKRLCWAVNCTGGSLTSLLPYIIQSGGHVSIGLGDHHYMELGCPDNSQLVAKCAAMARAAGREIMTTDETRALLGLKK